MIKRVYQMEIFLGSFPDLPPLNYSFLVCCLFLQYGLLALACSQALYGRQPGSALEGLEFYL